MARRTGLMVDQEGEEDRFTRRPYNKPMEDHLCGDRNKITKKLTGESR